MFDNDLFETWLNKKAGEVFDKVGREEPIRPDEMMILVLKAQANHFIHLDTDLRKDMRDLREDINGDVQDLRKDMRDLREDINRDVQDLRKDMKDLREDMNDLRKDMNDLRKDMNDLRKDTNELRQDTNVLRVDMNNLRGDVNVLREDMEKRFNRTQWLIGLGITFLTGLMSLYQFFQ